MFTDEEVRAQGSRGTRPRPQSRQPVRPTFHARSCELRVWAPCFQAQRTCPCVDHVHECTSASPAGPPRAVSSGGPGWTPEFAPLTSCRGTGCCSRGTPCGQPVTQNPDHRACSSVVTACPTDGSPGQSSPAGPCGSLGTVVFSWARRGRRSRTLHPLPQHRVLSSLSPGKKPQKSRLYSGHSFP